MSIEAKNYQPPVDTFLKEYKSAALATETKSIAPSEEDIYKGLFNIATWYGPIYVSSSPKNTIMPEDAAHILNEHYPDLFEQDMTGVGLTMGSATRYQAQIAHGNRPFNSGPSSKLEQRRGLQI